MAKVTYIGDKDDDFTPPRTEWSGIKFELNTPVDVPDDTPGLEKLRNNRFFKVEGGSGSKDKKSAKPTPPPPAGNGGEAA